MSGKDIKKNPFNMNEKDIILHRLFGKGEFSYTVSDLAKAVGPIIDLTFISQFIGVDGVTAFGYIAPLIMLFEMIGTCLSSGARNKVSSLVGAGDLEQANRDFSGSVLMGLGSSLIMTLLTAVFCRQISWMLGAREPEALTLTMRYLLGYLIGLPFFSLSRILTPYLQMEGQYARITFASILTTVIDVIGDALVIFVFHGGMGGIALATSFGYIIPFFVNAMYFLRKKYGSVFHFSLKGIRLDQCTEMIRLGASPCVIKGSNAVGGILINNMLTALHSPFLVAAYGVFSQITVFVRSAWYAPADTLHAFAGLLIGEEDRDSLQQAQRIALTHGLVLTALSAILLFALARPAAHLFLRSDDPAAIRMTKECIRVACFSLPFHAVVYNFNNYLMAVRKVRFCCFYSFLIECGIPVPVTFCMLQLAGYHGAWISKIVSMAIMSLIAVLYIRKYKYGFAFRDKMLLLPQDFGYTAENAIAVRSGVPEDLLDLSRIAVAFALEHGAGKERARTFGLLTEELALFFEKHSFADGKPHHINARLLAKDDDLMIALRDDCRPFNVTEYYQKVAECLDQGDELSLLIIMRMAKDVRYTAAFGANALAVRI